MKRIILLLVIGLLLVACSSSISSETAVTVPDEATQAATAVTEEQPVAETESEADTQPAEDAVIPGFPATTVEEAAIVRDRDWTLGAEAPIVAIIEYGDFQ